MFPYSLVIFDLDGTLVDSAPNIAEALNGTLQELGLQQFSEARIRSWIGEGVHVLLATALRDVGSTRNVDAAMPVMMRHYEASLLHNPPLYPALPKRWRACAMPAPRWRYAPTNPRVLSRRCWTIWASPRISAVCWAAIPCRSASPTRHRCCSLPDTSSAAHNTA